MKNMALLSNMLSVAGPLPHLIARSRPIIVATTPSIFSVDFSLSGLMFPAESVRMKMLSISTFRRQPILFGVSPNLLTPNPRARRHTPDQTGNTDNHRRTPVKVSGRLGDRGDAGNRTPVRCGVNGASPCAVYANATFRLRYLHKHIYRRT